MPSFLTKGFGFYVLTLVTTCPLTITSMTPHKDIYQGDIFLYINAHVFSEQKRLTLITVFFVNRAFISFIRKVFGVN